MRHADIAAALVFGMGLAGGSIAAEPALALPPESPLQRASAPRAVKVARTRTIPACTSFVDGAFTGGSTGSARKPHKTIAAAAAAANPGAVICVAEGVYAENLLPGTKPFTLAGGFRRGKDFKVRDSARYVSKARGNGSGSFLRIEDPGPSGNELTAIDGFEISGYAQAIYRDFYVSQRFDVTNNFIHDNVCTEDGVAGAGFALANVSGTIRGNVLLRNRCWRGGAGFLNDSTDENNVAVLNNLIKENAGTEPGGSHGGALYFFSNRLTVTGNEFVGNTVTSWGAGLYLGAFPPGGQHTNARLSWNVYRDNRAGIAGGGLFCDDAAKCISDHEIYDRNCGGNIYLDSGGGGPTLASFDHLTNVNAREVGCGAPGAGVQIDRDGNEPDRYSFTNAIFRGNAKNRDFAASCVTGCSTVKVNVTWSMVQKRYLNNGGLKVTFGPGILAPSDPRFVDPAAGDFHLKSTFGHWTRNGYVADPVSSPALAKGDPAGAVDKQPPRAGNRSELGAYGNSAEASYVR